MDLTLVAYYGKKPRDFGDLIIKVQRRLTSLLGNSFTPYELEQVHSTIIGLEGRRDGNRILNMNYMRLRHQRRKMDLIQINETIEQVLKLLPLQIRIAGYRASQRYPFTSRGEHPFVRSFTIHDDVAAAMGWPADATGFPPTLDRLRREFARANVLHKYHGSKVEIDNDFFFVVGQVGPEAVEIPSIELAECEMRAFLEVQEPLRIELRREHLSIVAYTDRTLPLKSSHAYPLDALRNQREELNNLFPEVDLKP